MNDFLTLDRTVLWRLAGWTMLHYLWLGALVGLSAGACRFVLRRASANVRYSTALVCLAVLALLPVVVAAWIEAKSPVADRPGQPMVVAVATEPMPLAEPAAAGSTRLSSPKSAERSSSAAASSKSSPALQVTANPRPNQGLSSDRAPVSSYQSLAAIALESCVQYLPWLWITGAPLTFLLLTTGIIGAERLQRSSQAVDGPIAELCVRLAQAMHIGQRVSVAVCERIATPVLVGIIRPIILLPPAALSGWSPDEIEMVLLHELAHVRRWDNLVNLAQRIVESLLFFHPAVWLVSNWVRREREACCDAVVVGRTNRPQAYAEMLVALAAQMPRSVLFHPAAVSAMAAGALRGRIRRILGLEDDPMLVSGKSLGAIMTGLLLATTLVVLNLPSQSRAEESATEKAEHARENVPRHSIGFLVFENVPFVVGASRFADGDRIKITAVKGSAATFEANHTYRIEGTYTLASRERASLSAFVTARNADDGRTSIDKNQTMIVERGSGKFALELRMPYDGWPHVSYYPAEGGASFGGVYFGTDDSVLKYWRDVYGSVGARMTGSNATARRVRIPTTEDQELNDNWPMGVVFPSPTEGIISERSWKTLGIKLVPATSKESQAVGRHRREVKVAGGVLIPRGFDVLILESIHGETVESFDDVDRILDRLEGLGDPIVIRCLITRNGVPGDVSFLVTPGNAFGAKQPGQTARKFPSLEDQKLADLAWKRLGLELEALNEADLERVQALGYHGGVKVASLTDRAIGQPMFEGDILVGLHVWPTTSLHEVAAVLSRDDLAELNPLKFYVVREITLRSDAEKFGPDVKDMVVTGRILLNLDDWSRQPSVLTPIEMMRKMQQASERAGGATLFTRDEVGPKIASEEDQQSAASADEPVEVNVVDELGSLRYNGKSFHEWQNAWRTELSTEKRLEAVKALAAFGASGYGRPAAEAIIDVAGQYDWTRWNRFKDIEDNPLQALFAYCFDAFFGDRGLVAARIPKAEAIDVLIAHADSGNPQVRAFVVQVLDDFRFEPRVGEVLVKLTRDGDQFVRRNAIRNLGHGWLQQPDEISRPVVERIHELLDSGDRESQREALAAVTFNIPEGGLLQGESAEAAYFPQVVLLLFSDDEEIRERARLAVGSIGPNEVPAVVDQLLKIIGDPQSTDRLHAVRALRSIGQNATAALPRLEGLFEATDDLTLRVAVAFAIDWIEGRERYRSKLMRDMNVMDDQQQKQFTRIYGVEEQNR